MQISSFDGSAPPGTPVVYGQKVMLSFTELGITGALGSVRPNPTQLGTQVLSKQEVFFQTFSADDKPSYDFAWEIQSPMLDQRIVMQGQQA